MCRRMCNDRCLWVGGRNGDMSHKCGRDGSTHSPLWVGEGVGSCMLYIVVY